MNAPTPDIGLWRDALQECLERSNRYSVIALNCLALGDDKSLESSIRSLRTCDKFAADIFREFGPYTGPSEPKQEAT